MKISSHNIKHPFYDLVEILECNKTFTYFINFSLQFLNSVLVDKFEMSERFFDFSAINLTFFFGIVSFECWSYFIFNFNFLISYKEGKDLVIVNISRSKLINLCNN